MIFIERMAGKKALQAVVFSVNYRLFLDIRKRLKLKSSIRVDNPPFVSDKTVFQVKCNNNVLTFMLISVLITHAYFFFWGVFALEVVVLICYETFTLLRRLRTEPSFRAFSVF